MALPAAGPLANAPQTNTGTMKTVLILRGDGIGPEVTEQGVKVLRVMAAEAAIEVEVEEALIGAAALDAAGVALPEQTLARAGAADAILFGAVGDPRYDRADFYLQPGKGLLRLRRELELYANLRPVKAFSAALQASPLKAERIEGVDLMIVRELTGGIYFGEPRGIKEEAGERYALNTMIYTEREVERIVRFAFELARKRRRKLTSVDKGNALEVGRFWRDTAARIAQEYADVETHHLYVDNAAMQIIREPAQFDTLVMGNMFGDILSDAAANIVGSLGMLPSASIGRHHALYEPCHGSAPDIAGRDIANPIASILSVGMLFGYSFDRPEIEETVHRAVNDVLARYRTADIMEAGKTQVGCTQMGDLIAERLQRAG